MRHQYSCLFLLKQLLLVGACLGSLEAFGQHSEHNSSAPTLARPDDKLALNVSSTSVCTGTVVTFTAVDNSTSGCQYYQWVESGSPETSTTPTANGEMHTCLWNTAGTYTVSITARCDNQSVTQSRTITVVAPTSGPITCTTTGTVCRISDAGATISAGLASNVDFTLIPPVNSSKWVWSGVPLPMNSGGGVAMNSQTGRIGVNPRKTATYTLAYDMPGVPCRLTKSFTVTVIPPEHGDHRVIDTERFGAGLLVPKVAETYPEYTYSWQEYVNNTPTTVSNSASYPVYLTANRLCYLDLGCSYQLPVALTIKWVRIRANGQVPTSSVALSSAATPPSIILTAETDPSATTSTYQWYRDGQLLTGATTVSLNVLQPGSYTVRIPGPTPTAGMGDSYIASPVEVTGPLDNQVVNDQTLTYRRDIKVLKANTLTVEEVASLGVAERLQTVTYTNGFGQPLQQVAVQAGPAQEDIIQHFDYAGAVTEARSFLPFPLASSLKAPGLFDTEAADDVDEYYQDKGGQPYATTTLEASPLARPLSQTQSGTAWAGHAATLAHQYNTDPEVRYWFQPAGATTFQGQGWYGAGQLSKQVQLDPDNRRTEIFTDAQGRVVLQRKVGTTPGSSTTVFDTYQVYDEAGRLRLTIPPAAVAEMTSSNNWNLTSQGADFAARWLYQYSYDERGRLVERQFPGAAPVYLVYDQFDRPILVQDGNHRQQDEWLFTKYDAQGRVAVTGLYKKGSSRQTMQLKAYQFSSSLGYESRSADGYTTDQTFPDRELTLLSETFYDDYDLDQDVNQQPDASYQPATFAGASAPEATDQLRGLLTATRRRVVLPDQQYGDWLTTFYFYDQYGNVIQKRGDNQLVVGSLSDRTSLLYREQGFVSQVLQAEKTQETGAFEAVAVRNRFTYDAAGRPLQTWQQHQFRGDWEPEVLLTSNHYTGLGELTQKQLHSRDGVRFLQTEDFAYNQHGQLTRINHSNLTVNPENDLFGLELGRETPLNGLGGSVRYDGGISAVTWGAHNPDRADQPDYPERERSYSFTYDGLGRLTAAAYAARSTAMGMQWNQESGAYNEDGIQYDANGNITRLKRYTQAIRTAPVLLIDDLEFIYEQPGGGGLSNQLQQVNDRSGNPRGFNASASNGYGYDENGSATYDKSKGVEYVYNSLNKVEQQRKSGNSIRYTYDAAGTVLQRDVVVPTGTKTYYYVDGFMYEQSPSFNGLRSLPTPEGRALAEDEQALRLTYEYHLRDHLGNLRVAFRAQAGQENLRLSSETNEVEGEYPRFRGIAASRLAASTPFGSQVAAVSSTQAGPSIVIPVADRDHLKLRVWYQTPAGVQYSNFPTSDARTAIALRWGVTPVLLPAPGTTYPERPNRVSPGIQLSLVGGLSRLLAPRATRQSQPPVANRRVYDAYVRWTLRNADGEFIMSGRQVAAVVSTNSWSKLDLPLNIDLSSEEKRTGTLVIEELNDGGNAVLFDSLTITHPLDRALVSQENHYYPFGMALSGVAVNTISAAEISKQQFNGGSDLEDELLGTEGGVYSTPFRIYDPVTGRFTGVDPLAHATPDLSPYHFSNNDPVNYSDPSGALFNGGGPSFLDILKSIGNFITSGFRNIDDLDFEIVNGIKRPLYPLGRSNDGRQERISPPNTSGLCGCLPNINIYTRIDNNASSSLMNEGNKPVSPSKKNDYSLGKSLATTTLALIETDVAIPDPTDAAWPKWAAYAVAGTVATVIVYNESYSTTSPSDNDFYYVTYIKSNPNGKVYVGRSSGFGNPDNIVKNRDTKHHMTAKGYGPATLSSYAKATIPGGYPYRAGDPSYWFIRGSEQYQILNYRAAGVSGNSINGISPSNPNLLDYMTEALKFHF